MLRAEAIGKRFRRRQVLSSATLWAVPGRVTVLLGRNGAGKSTLLRIAAGWMRADYGIVIFKNERFLRPRLSHLAAHGLWYVPERSLLCSTVTLREHFAALRRRFPHAVGGEAVELLRLGDLLDRMPARFSTGERRRAEIALALTRRPECLLADEPFLGINPADAELLCHAVRALARRGTGVVLSGHEVPVLLDLADDVIWQTAGTTHFLGTPARACEHDQFVREYLGSTGFAGRRRPESTA